jgi:chromate transporter
VGACAAFLTFECACVRRAVAHIALAEDEIVNRRKWLTREHYLDLVAATNLIPGPNSTEVMIHVGHVMRGVPGAILSGFCFIFPVFLITLILAVIYVQSGTLPQINALLWGIKPVIIAVIANAGYRLMQTALKGFELWLLFALSLFAIGLLNVPEVIVMLSAGMLYALYRSARNGATAFLFLIQPITQQATIVTPSLFDIFWYFLKIGSVLFGSGYLLVAYIQQDLVTGLGWLTPQQLLDAVAIGQTTPGPVFTTATVVGYIAGGFPGAIVATIGIFLPAFVLVILTAPLIPRMRQSKVMSAFLSGINAGVVAAILVTLVELTNVAVRTPDGLSVSPVAIVLAVGSLLALVRWKVNATWLIMIGAIVGLLLGR